MKHPWRLGLFLAGSVGLGGLYLAACFEIAAPAERPHRYAAAVNRLALAERHVTDVITAVNFDIRGFDTLGEEYILFVSVLGAIVLLRETEEQKGNSRRDAGASARVIGPGDAVRMWSLGMSAPMVIFGLYMACHGQLAPGGGFQGGVILATGPLLIYLASDFETFKRVASHPLIEVAEAVGAGGFALIGFLAWFGGRPFLTNVLPLGTTGELLSGGTIMAIDYAVSLEVAAGFTLLLYVFLQSTLNPQRGRK